LRSVKPFRLAARPTASVRIRLAATLLQRRRSRGLDYREYKLFG